jgi:hypothetical protein
MTIVEDGVRSRPMSIGEITPSYYWIQTKTGSRIPGIMFRNTKKRAKNDYVILFSHGNSSNLATMYECYLDMCYTLSVCYPLDENTKKVSAQSTFCDFYCCR